MNVTVKTLPKSQVQLSIEVPAEKMEKYREKAVKQISQNIRVPGFREGHVPFEILKEKVGDDVIADYTIEIALPETYSEALLKEKVQAVSRPKINIIEKNPLKYEATVAVYPEVKISGYDKIEIKKNEPKVEDKDVEEVLSNVQKRRATFKTVDRAAKKGDRVEIDFEGFDDGGAALENTKSANHPLVIGDNSLVPGFEDNLEGMKAGEKKSFKVTFPKDYFHKPFQGKAVEFKVDMKKVDEMELPEWTPEFIKSIVGEEKTLDDLKKFTRENLEQDKKHEEKVRRENEFLEKLIELTKVEIPDALLEEEIDGMIEEFKNELSERGVPFDKFLESTKKKIEDLREDRKKEAMNRLTLRFGLQQLFEQEKIEVTPEELKKEVDHIISLYPEAEQAKVRSEYGEGTYMVRRLENKIRMDKLFERFLGK